MSQVHATASLACSSGLIVLDGEIGVMKKGGLFAHTNFTFEGTCVVSSPDGASVPMYGHLYRIRISGGAERECFISNEDSACFRGFTHVASRTLRGVQCVKCSDAMWGQYIFQECESFHKSTGFCSKVLVSAVGRQPDSNTWVLGPSIQIDSQVMLIPSHLHCYFWCQEYQLQKDPTEEQQLTPLPISLPLGDQGLCMILQKTKACLGSNIYSCIQIVCGAVMALHFEDILVFQDECPLVLAYSAVPGTGKTTSLRVSLSLCGVCGIHFKGGKSTVSSLLSCASVTTIPIGVDNISSATSFRGHHCPIFQWCW